MVVKEYNLDMKYIVLKLEDIRRIPSEWRQQQFWSMVKQIIQTKEIEKRIKNDNKNIN